MTPWRGMRCPDSHISIPSLTPCVGRGRPRPLPCSEPSPSRDLQLNSAQKVARSLFSFLSRFKAASKFLRSQILAGGCQETQPATSTCRFCTHNTAGIAVLLRVPMTGRSSSPPRDAIPSLPGRAVGAAVLPPLHRCLFINLKKKHPTPDSLNSTRPPSL